MAEQQETPAPDPHDLLRVLAAITDNSQRLIRGIADRHCATNGAGPDPSTSDRRSLS